jgi:hypothetical protein
MVDVYYGTNYQIVVELGSLVELGASALGNWLGSKREVGCEEGKISELINPTTYFNWTPIIE